METSNYMVISFIPDWGIEPMFVQLTSSPEGLQAKHLKPADVLLYTAMRQPTVQRESFNWS